MKIISFTRKGKVQVGVLKNNNTEIVPVTYLGYNTTDMSTFLEKLTPEKHKRIERKKEMLHGIAIEEVSLVAPIQYPRQDMICLGINYLAHGEESAKFHEDAFFKEKSVPIYFSKRINRCLGDSEDIDGHFDIVEGLDYEVELGVIIGKDAKNVSKEEANDYILGYTIINDVSARNLQIKHQQWYFGKSLDDFVSMGPWIVTHDEFTTPISLGIRCYVNDELRQDGNTSQLITTIPEIIEELSRGMTLKKGTIIATGTPAGVGMGFDPPKFLKSGDKVRCEIEGIGFIDNRIK
ncbi:MAG: fumarylacetoacetate hydrolase family protein [Bacillota bacterium]